MAHQWNGDLVTMGWWDDLWLNESFASWMAARETDLRNPDWHWWEGQDADKESAMEADASAASHPIMTPVRDEVEVANASDPQITYSKGQAVLRMLESYLGPDTFRAGVRAFLHARAYSNATSEDLWQALDAASGKKVSEVAAGWTEQAGFPLVSVSAACDAQGARSLRLAQARFLLRGTPPPARWRVPLRLRSGSDGAVQPLLLTEDGQAVAAGRCDAPLSLNADDVGFYRVRYDEATLAANTRAFASLPEADRIALLDDQWALVEAGAQELPGYLALVAAMRPGMHARAWDQVAHALGTLETAQRGRPGHDAFAAFARAALAPEAARLGWEPGAQEPADLRQLRRTLLGFLGAWGDPATRAEAHRRFERFAADRGALAPDDQALVLSLVAIDADAATFERLHELARKAPDEAELRRDYQALMSVRDPALAAQAAQIALSEEIPPQAADLRLSLLLALADGNPAASWSAFTGNSERLLAPYVSIAPLLVSQVLPQVYWREVPLEQIEGWIREHVPADLSTQVAHGMDNARFRVSERDALVPAADRSLAAVRG